MRRFRWLFVSFVLPGLLAGGCGPLILPMTTRLREEDQKTVDGMWANMITPANRVDHQTLLDTILVFMLFQLGVDKLHLVAEKQVPNGKVVMEIDCDRASPATDQFTVTVMDDHGRTLRRERYSRQDVEESAAALNPHVPTTMPTTEPATLPTHTLEPKRDVTSTMPMTRKLIDTALSGHASQEEMPDQKRHRLEYERRMKAVQAATQPAAVAP